MNLELVLGLCYILASILFVFGLKMLSSADTARRGNIISGLGMLLAIVVTLIAKGMSYQWIIIGAVAGAGLGAVVAKFVKMTAMPEMVSLFNGFGGLASLLVGWGEFHASFGRSHGLAAVVEKLHGAPSTFTVTAIYLTILIGGVTFAGSLVAYGKLAGKIPGKPIQFGGQNIANGLLLIVVAGLGMAFCLQAGDHMYALLIASVILANILGVMSAIPIGGADMPVVICLLNSCSGLAACAAGFVICSAAGTTVSLGGTVLIVSGSLVGASGIILTQIMCKAMNRSITNVLFSGFGSAAASAGGAGCQGEAKPVSCDDAYLMLEAATSICFVPGYGMAAAQAQHALRELGELLEENGAEVQYCIHPVAGRMPGHMNVLLAEANVPYEQLVEPQDVNPNMSLVDVAVVIGANDVVNPAARENENSPLWGMPIINVDLARTCIVLKRSLKPGFAGVDNPLFFKENTRMLFGDAKSSIAALVSEFKS